MCAAPPLSLQTSIARVGAAARLAGPALNAVDEAEEQKAFADAAAAAGAASAKSDERETMML